MTLGQNALGSTDEKNGSRASWRVSNTFRDATRCVDEIIAVNVMVDIKKRLVPEGRFLVTEVVMSRNSLDIEVYQSPKSICTGRT